MTTNTPDSTIHDELVREFVTLQHRVAPDLARMEEIKKALRDLDYGSHELAGQKVSISRNATFNKSTFRDIYPPEQYPQYYKMEPDLPKIKDDLPGKVVQAMYNEGEKKVSVK